MRTNHQVYQFGSPAGPHSATSQLSDLELELLSGFSENLCRALGTVVGGRRPLVARYVFSCMKNETMGSCSEEVESGLYLDVYHL